MNNTGNNTGGVPRNMSNDSCEAEMENSVEKVINIIGYTVIILASIIGNLLLICTVKRNSRFNTITYRLIINMAAADILVTVCNMPGRLTRQITGRYHWQNARHGWTSRRILQSFLERHFFFFNLGPQLCFWLWLPLSNTKTRGYKTNSKKRCGTILHQKLEAYYPFEHWLQNRSKIYCKPN